jgi:hypothetical protein
MMTDDQELRPGKHVAQQELHTHSPSCHWGTVQPGARKHVDAYPELTGLSVCLRCAGG